MDFAFGIERHRRDLRPVLALLFAMAGLGAGIVAFLPRRVHLAILEILLPAEAAVRRLIAVAAAQMVVAPGKARAAPVGGIPRGDKSERLPCFKLFDPRKPVGSRKKRTSGKNARIRTFDEVLRPSPEKPPLSPDDPVDAAALCRRLLVLREALDDIPKHAKRLARMLARKRTKFLRVMRPGRPPGHRARRRHVVDHILADCHDLALYALDVQARAGPD